MNIEPSDRPFFETDRVLREKRIAYANLYDSPSQMIAKIDAMILDLERQKAISNELIAKCYELRGAESRREK